jgi:hypothetical protein
MSAGELEMTRNTSEVAVCCSSDSDSSRSEEGEILIRWGFKPKVLGYIPNVRGAVTGVP